MDINGLLSMHRKNHGGAVMFNVPDLLACYMSCLFNEEKGAGIDVDHVP